MVDLYLIDAVEVDLDGILGSRDVALWRVEDVQACVQRYGLATARRARDQHHALRLVQCMHEELFLVRPVTQLVDTHLCRGRVEDPQHNFLAPHRGQRVNTKVDGAGFGQFHLDAPILGYAALGDVHLRHYFQSSGQPPSQVDRRVLTLSENAVCAKAHSIAPLVGLEVDVGCVHFDRI